MAETVMNTVVPGGGFEPPTRGFSIQCYLNDFRTLARKPSVENSGTKREAVNQPPL